MSLIAHLCTRCGHPDFWRSGAAGGSCSCGCTCTPGEPELRPTFDVASRPVARIVPPGEKVGGLSLMRTHDCKGCRALYERLTAA